MTTYHDSHEEMQAAGAAADAKQKAVLLGKIAEANDRLFVKECAAAGVDPARGVSPSLLKLLGWRPDSVNGDPVMTKADAEAVEPFSE